MTQKWTFGNPIKLTMSGGGYRAAAFHLGVLSYLDRAGILHETDTISTVSGGTITGITYVLALKKKRPFDTFFKKLYNSLATTNVLSRGLAYLGKKSPHTLSGDYNLITSFAEVYNDCFTENSLFGELWEGDDIHLHEIVFNATEFTTGLAYRFQKSASPRARIGNARFAIPEECAKNIRMADILAASTCYPGGCEPLAFPHDFVWPENEIPPALKEKFPVPLPLMDGGAYDNQGIDSAVLADERSENKIGALIISDVDRPNDDIYRFPKDRKKGFLSLSLLNILSFVLMVLLFLSSLALAGHYAVNLIHGAGAFLKDIFLFLIPSLVSFGSFWMLFWVRRKIIARLRESSPEIGASSWRDIKRITVDQFLDMAELRVTSIYALTSEILLKRIRRLVYSTVYRNSNYDNKRISCLIYDLQREGKRHVESWLEPSEKIKEVCRRASEMDTTLWFNKISDLRDVTACGQFTMCYNLLEFIIRGRRQGTFEAGGDIDRIFQNAKKDWEQLQEDPYVLLDAMLREDI
ncbi:MAG TPA: patatin-like phospholipase family protein [Spirochaetota bacterium]|nr:patatin-like phospholipase family protein [Spirochaetota bacterium]